jgi:hypothetical protein
MTCPGQAFPFANLSPGHPAGMPDSLGNALLARVNGEAVARKGSESELCRPEPEILG